MYNSFCGNMFSFFLGRCPRVITVGSFKCVFNFKKLPSYNTSKVVKTFYMRIRDTRRPAMPHPELWVSADGVSPQLGVILSHPSAPPPYEDRSPLYPGSPPPGGYAQLSVMPGGYPAYPQPGYGRPCWLPTAYAPSPRDAHELWPRPWL